MLKSIFIIIMCFAALAAVMGNAYAWEFSFDNYPAYAMYSENGDVSGVSVSGDWKAFYYEGIGALSKYDNKDFQGEINYGMGVSSKSTETWDVNDSEFQKNDISFWNINTGILAGWALTVPAPREFGFTITPLIGYGWRFDRFTRQNFNILDVVTITDIVDEDYNIHSLELGGRISIDFEKASFYVKPIFGIVVFDEARNSVVGQIRGRGGFTLDFDAGIDYPLTKHIILGAAFKMGLQKLNGGTKGNIIWPENMLQTYGCTVSIRGKF